MHLGALGEIGRREADASTAEQDHRGRAVWGCRDERPARGHLDRKIGRVHDQVVHVVFGFGFQRQPIQAGDDGEPTDRRNPPWVGRRRAGPDIDPPRSEASLDATLGKHFHDEPLIAALERRTIRSLTTTRDGGGEASAAAKSSKLGRLIPGSPSVRIAARSPAAAACSRRRNRAVTPSGGACAGTGAGNHIRAAARQSFEAAQR